MAGEDPKRSRLLIALLVVLVALAAYQYSDVLFKGPEVEQVEKSEISLGEGLANLEKLPTIALDKPYQAEQYASQRNLFDFSKSPEQIAAERARKEQAAAKAEREQQQQQQQAERAAVRRERMERERELNPPKPRVPPPPNFEFTYVAYIKQLSGPENSIAVLVKGSGARDPKKENIMIVRHGEIIEEDFVVKEIDLDALVIGYTDERYKGQSKRVELIPPSDGGSRGRGGGGRRRR